MIRDETLIAIDLACRKETTLDGLRRTFTSFKRLIDTMNETNRGISRVLYWKHMHRVKGDRNWA